MISIIEIMHKTRTDIAELSESSQKELRKYYSEKLVLDTNVDKSMTTCAKYLNKNDKVLDIGCGNGTASIYFASRGCIVDGIDVTSRAEVAIERIEKHFPKLKDKINIKLKSVLDYQNISDHKMIWMDQTYHHLEPRDEVNSKLKEITKPGDYLCIFDENMFNPISQLLVLKKRGFKTIRMVKTDCGDIPVGDERLTSVGYLIKTFRKLGFKHIETKRYKVLPKQYYGTIMDKVLNFIAPVLPFLFIRYLVIFKKLES